MWLTLRDRPFNLNFFFDFFFQNLTLDYMTKTLNQNIFFQQHWESEYFFRKNPIPPPQVKWSFPNMYTCR